MLLFFFLFTLHICTTSHSLLRSVYVCLCVCVCVCVYKAVCVWSHPCVCFTNGWAILVPSFHLASQVQLAPLDYHLS